MVSSSTKSFICRISASLLSSRECNDNAERPVLWAFSFENCFFVITRGDDFDPIFAGADEADPLLDALEFGKRGSGTLFVVIVTLEFRTKSSSESSRLVVRPRSLALSDTLHKNESDTSGNTGVAFPTASPKTLFDDTVFNEDELVEGGSNGPFSSSIVLY